MKALSSLPPEAVEAFLKGWVEPFWKDQSAPRQPRCAVEPLTPWLHIIDPVCSVRLLPAALLTLMGRAQGSLAENKVRVSQMGTITGPECGFGPSKGGHTWTEAALGMQCPGSRAGLAQLTF